MSVIKKCAFIAVFMLGFNAFGNESNKENLLNSVKNYQTLLGKGEFSKASIEAEIAYNISQQLFEVDSANHIAITEDFGFSLIQSKQYNKAIPILQSLISIIENAYSTHSSKLISVLGDLALATQSINPELSKELTLRQTRLHLRYNSNQYVEHYSTQALRSTQQARNLAEDLSDVTNNTYKIMDAGQWDLIYNEGSDFNFGQLVKQLDKSYRSALGFLISFNTLSKPPEEKLKAVFFSSRDDYKAYLISQKSLSASLAAEKSSGVYARHLNTLFLFDQQLKNDKKNRFRVLSVLRHEVAHQLFFNLGLQSRSRNVEYPRWLTEGLASSLEFNNFTHISGPQTENFSFMRLSKLKQRLKKGPLTTIAKLVSIRVGSEGLAGKHNPDIYEVGGFLVRFLYETQPDKFRKYMRYLTKTHRSKLSSRSSVFYRIFGNKEILQASFDKYLTTMISQMDESIKQRKKNKKKKVKVQ
jgi:hypothetical protein